MGGVLVWCNRRKWALEMVTGEVCGMNIPKGPSKHGYLGSTLNISGPSARRGVFGEPDLLGPVRGA